MKFAPNCGPRITSSSSASWARQNDAATIDITPHKIGTGKIVFMSLLWNAGAGRSTTLTFLRSTDFGCAFANGNARSVRLDADLLDNRTPLRHLGLQVGGKLGRRGWGHFHAHFLELCSDRGMRKRGNHVLVHLGNDIRRRPGWHE